MIPSVDQLEVADKRVFVRVDFNVPLDEAGRITDDSRICAALPTIQWLLDAGAVVILASHLGRPQGEVNPKYSLLPVAEALTEHLNCDVTFPENCVGAAVERLSRELRPGNVMLLENLRFHAGETDNDPEFAAQLARLADVYVNDAFGTCHRAHASTAGMVVHFQAKAAGLLVQKELQELARLAEDPGRPFWAIIGGAKVSDKIGLIEKLLDKVNGIVLGGGLAYTFLQAQGHEIGASRLDESKLRVAKRILEKANKKGVKVLLPIDHKVAPHVSMDATATAVDHINVPDGQMALDIGDKTAAVFAEALASAKTIFWNGPLGFFENPNFAEGTRAVAQAVANADAISVIGGGDSAAALKQLGLVDQVTHISTGGGASLAFLEGRELPGLKALEEQV